MKACLSHAEIRIARFLLPPFPTASYISGADAQRPPARTVIGGSAQATNAPPGRIDPANFEVLVDGKSNAVVPHRITTPLFSFVGDLSLSTPAFDSCITGQPQSGVFDGWQFLLAPAGAGEDWPISRCPSSMRRGP
jgi:hypothetical protein